MENTPPKAETYDGIFRPSLATRLISLSRHWSRNNPDLWHDLTQIGAVAIIELEANPAYRSFRAGSPTDEQVEAYQLQSAKYAIQNYFERKERKHIDGNSRDAITDAPHQLRKEDLPDQDHSHTARTLLLAALAHIERSHPAEVQAFCLVKIEGYTVDELAEALKVSGRTIKRRIQRTRQLLKPLLATPHAQAETKRKAEIYHLAPGFTERMEHRFYITSLRALPDRYFTERQATRRKERTLDDLARRIYAA